MPLAMSHLDRGLYTFLGFEFDPVKRVLLKDGAVVALQPKAADLLAALLEAHGQLVTKDALMRQVWPDSFVEEGNLAVNVFALRRALGDDGERFIKTYPKRGYVFVPPWHASRARSRPQSRHHPLPERRWRNQPAPAAGPSQISGSWPCSPPCSPWPLWRTCGPFEWVG